MKKEKVKILSSVADTLKLVAKKHPMKKTVDKPRKKQVKVRSNPDTIKPFGIFINDDKTVSSQNMFDSNVNKLIKEVSGEIRYSCDLNGYVFNYGIKRIPKNKVKEIQDKMEAYFLKLIKSVK